MSTPKPTWSHKKSRQRAKRVQEMVNALVPEIMKEFNVTRQTALQDVRLASYFVGERKRTRMWEHG